MQGFSIYGAPRGQNYFPVKLDDKKSANNLKMVGNEQKCSMKCKEKIYQAQSIDDAKNANGSHLEAKATSGSFSRKKSQ
jgi:Ni,Fe-hydrogenase III large subunit